MRKSDLSEQQLFERDLFVKTLETAEWYELSVNDQFDQNHWVPFAAVMEFGNSHLYLRLYQNPQTRVVNFRTDSNGKELDINIVYESRIELLLEVFISIQEDFNKKNYKDILGEIIEIFPQVYATISDEYVKLTQDNIKKLSF